MVLLQKVTGSILSHVTNEYKIYANNALLPITVCFYKDLDIVEAISNT